MRRRMSPDVLTDSAVAGFAKNAAYAGSASAVYGGLTANEIAAFGGLAVAVIGVIVQFLFRLRDDRRNAELHRERLAKIREGVIE